MKILLKQRTLDHVRVFFVNAQKPKIRAVFPLEAQTLREEIARYKESLRPDSSVYRRIIEFEGKYIGDVWAYLIDLTVEPNAMLRFCIFDEKYWNKGIATIAVSKFLEELHRKYNVKSIGAFSLSSNVSALKVLQKNGFSSDLEYWIDERRIRLLFYSFTDNNNHTFFSNNQNNCH